MRRIYHLVPPRDWDPHAAAPYRAASLATEGFIHCSNLDQVARVANLFYGGEVEMMLLCIDAARLGSALRDEDIGTGEQFPHIYGPIERSAILEVRSLCRAPDGRWTLTDGVQ